jgi:hypothetical protein
LAHFFYENITVPLLIITLWQIAQAADGCSSKLYDYSLPAISAICVLLRPSMHIIFTLLIALLGGVALKKRNSRIFILTLSMAVTIFAVHAPILIANHGQFGVFILNTQSGFELLQGHNPLARGAWAGNWWSPTTEIYNYTVKSIPELSLIYSPPCGI